MALNGPVIMVEDDTNDADVITAAIRELGVRNEIKPFHAAQEALDYLMATTDKPLLILSDIRMPGMDGLSLLRRIQNTEYLHKKSIPFVFFTAIATREIVNEAFDIGVQGFYKKAHDYVGLRDQIFSILSYWTRSLHPNSDIIG